MDIDKSIHEIVYIPVTCSAFINYIVVYTIMFNCSIQLTVINMATPCGLNMTFKNIQQHKKKHCFVSGMFTVKFFHYNSVFISPSDNAIFIQCFELTSLKTTPFSALC